MKKEKRKTYRERYFEDYKAVKVPCSSKKGYRIEYRYLGLWNSYVSDGLSLKAVKLLMACAELLGAALYAAAILSGTPLTRSHPASGFGALSLIPWLLACSGVVRFVLCKPHVKEASCKEIGESIGIGCMAHAILLGLSALAGGIDVLRAGTAAASDIPAAAAILLFGGVSLFVRQRYNRLIVLTFRNENGQPGKQM